MPHPIISSTTNVVLPFYVRYNYALITTGSNTGICGKTLRPASINNPKIKGYRAPSNWYATSHRWSTSDGNVTLVRNDNNVITSTSGCILGFSTSSADAIAELDQSLANALLRSALSDLLEEDVAFNAFLLQGKQSLRMVRDLATGLAHGTDKLMTAEFGKPKAFRQFLAKAGDKAISKFSGKYLEFLYGWKPLADDVENAFQYMIDGYTGPEQKKFRLAARKSPKWKQSIDFVSSVSSYYTANWQITQTLAKENRAKIVLNYQFPSQACDMLPTMTPFGTAWELAPWSFVLDWFDPVGEWIGAMEATQYSVYLENAVLTQSVKVSSQPGTLSRWSLQNITSGYSLGSCVPPRFHGQSYKMTRQILGASSVLDRIKFPPFASKFGLPQASQALALLSQVTRKWF